MKEGVKQRRERKAKQTVIGTLTLCEMKALFIGSETLQG